MTPSEASRERFLGRLAAAPCCAAITSGPRLDDALASPVAIVFILRANGLTLRPIVQRIHAADRLVAVHLDLVDGVRPDRAGVAWLAHAGVDAIISSQGQLVPAIRREGIVAIHRLLLIRHSLMEAAFAAAARSGADIVELLPGVILPEIAPLMPRLAVPVLAGGFIRTEAEARAILAAGAAGVTTSSTNLWSMSVG
ncbi:MAG TPA: glycerol-3-phosphate responsive antiterminator [Candidatus Acidoferrales bacterium]|nr:glycerol-3-phosphate responsive antiterminator [Candidatus Acidoferrales bacterium]